MSAPANFDEYLVRFHHNTSVVGYGLNVITHVPCPFCAAPDFQVYGILTATEDMQREATCIECHRSAKVIVNPIEGGAKLEVVQTGGPDVPAWLPPIRRI